jgi:hypothetical protein
MHLHDLNGERRLNTQHRPICALCRATAFASKRLAHSNRKASASDKQAIQGVSGSGPCDRIRELRVGGTGPSAIALELGIAALSMTLARAKYASIHR